MILPVARVLQPYQERVVAERDAVAERRRRLLEFMDTVAYDALDAAERDLMRQQAGIMAEYVGVLNRRIEAFAPQLDGPVQPSGAMG